MTGFIRKTWVEVDLDAICANVAAFRKHIPTTTGIMAVVKADGYGHGSVQIGREALAAGADSLAVALLDEAIVLRQAGITAPILVLGYTPVEGVIPACKWDVELTAYHTEWVVEAEQRLRHQEQEKLLGIHVKIDTGMGRIGVRTEKELLRMVEALEQSHGLSWTGIFTHFACADEADTTHVKHQYEQFQELLSGLKKNGYFLPKVHCCNTAAAIAFPEWGYDTIRLGIGLYGLYPSPWIKDRYDIQLKPTLSLKTRITHVKKATEAMTVSYGATYTAEPGEWIATLPIGYADGFSRALSNRGYALHAGKRVPIVGKVCMDQMMIRLDTDAAKVGDEVVLYGRQGDEEISVDEVAEQLGTINYEVTCMLNHRVPRVYIQGGRIVNVQHLVKKC